MVFSGKSIRSAANKFLNKLLQPKDETVVEAKADVWRSMYPFFCDQALSTPVVAIESLKILDVLIDDGIVGDYKNLQKALLHKSDEVARLALDVLRKIKGLTTEARMGGVEPVSAYNSIGSMENVLKKKDIQSRVLSVLKKEDTGTEKTTDIEKNLEELGQNYNNKFKALEEGIEDLEKLVDSMELVSADSTASSMESALKKKDLQSPVLGVLKKEDTVSEKTTDIEKKVEELGQKIPEVPSNTTQDYDTKFKAIEDGIEELKKLVDSNIVNENALAEKFVSEKLIDIEKKVEELSQKIPEVPSNLTTDYDNKFKALEDGIEDLKKLVDSNIVNENALAEKFVSEKLTDIEKKVEELGQKIPEVPSNTTQDYDNKFKALEDGIADLKKLMDSKIVNENALTEKVTGQVLERIRPAEHVSKSRSSPVPQFTQKTAEDSRYSKDQEVRVNSLDNTSETSIILLNWAKFLMEKVGRSKLADVLEYYVEIGWISGEVSSVIADYANGIDYYVETPTEDLLPEVHTKSLLFIEQLRRRKIDKKLSSVPAYR